jgi:hypothetical protein
MQHPTLLRFRFIFPIRPTTNFMRCTVAGLLGMGLLSAAQAQTEAPPPENETSVIAPLVNDPPGILTAPRRVVIEPSVQYSYSSSNRIALVGYTVIPAILVGLVDVREVKRNTVTAALTGRFGLSTRTELEIRLPYVHRSDTTVSRALNAASYQDTAFEASGTDIGDVEFGLRHQLNNGGTDLPYFVGSLRYKTRYGKSPFDVETNCSPDCASNTVGTGLPLELPTGSGFSSVQIGVTTLMPSDPAVFFGSITYTHTLPRDNISRNLVNNQQQFIGRIEPGGVLGFNFGMGLAINEKSSFSLGYDHNSVETTRINGEVPAGSVRTQLGTLQLGYSHRISPKTSLNVSVGAGLTRDTPDLTLTIRLPITF